MNVFTCMYTHSYTYYTYMYITRAHAYTHKHAYLHVYKRMKYIYECVCMCVCVCACVSVRMYVGVREWVRDSLNTQVPAEYANKKIPTREYIKVRHCATIVPRTLLEVLTQSKHLYPNARICYNLSQSRSPIFRFGLFGQRCSHLRRQPCDVVAGVKSLSGLEVGVALVYNLLICVSPFPCCLVRRLVMV